ncbi:CYFA0S01e01860g1_1 [Cyberlindnera fabianii]|uniref:aromatic-amino-acid transaminase n=1 Tax=Cyberlindnera fabianii TaxID=36022 RepID=A0A061AMF2_CYBFA|nr:CYFA0S01e01860g1_1 [Cyberlindnera fabianii]
MVAAAKDLSHLLSNEAKARNPSALKTAFKYYGKPDIVFLGGGLPLADYFPWNKITTESPAAPFAKGIGAAPETDDEKVVVDLVKFNKDITHEKDIPLARSLQYGSTEGQKELIDFLKEHTKIVHNVPYDDWNLITTIGNTEAWDSILRTFCNRGDTILVESHTFPSALETCRGLGVNTFPVPMDDFGIVPEKLKTLMDSWVGPKPKLLYTIPTGQNPTGSSLSPERRRAIYKIAQKHDFIILEDEPYYFLQMDEYTQDTSARESKGVHSHKEFISALVDSFIKIDTEGRVVRLDSFSKVLAPGTRFGWIVAQDAFLERIVRLHEVTIQSPSGFTQAIVNGLLQRWGQEGYIDWLIGLRAEYTHKRDVAIDSIVKHFPSEVVHFTPPVAGMFFTVHFDASKHPKFATEFGSDPLKVENALYEAGLAEGCLMIPGSWFLSEGQSVPPQEVAAKEKSTSIFFRGTYAAVPLDQLAAGLQRFGTAASKEFGF